MSTPGAVTSGFICSEIGVGPLDEKPAITSAGPLSPSRRCGDGDRLRRVAGRADGAVPAVAEVVAGRDHRDDARVGGAVDRLHDDVARRLDLRLAEREVDHVHAVLDRLLDSLRDLRRVAVEPEVGGRHGQHLVVAEVRARRDPETRARGRSASVASVSWSPAAMPATFVACSEFSGSNGVFAYFHAGVSGANAFATITFGVVNARVPLREARRDT